MEKKSLLLESLVVTERNYEVNTSNFHGLENIHKGEAAHLSLQNWFLSSFQNLFLLGFVQQCGSLPCWHSQTTTSKWVNIQKYNKQPLVAANHSIWEVMLILKKGRLDLADEYPLPHHQHNICCSVIFLSRSDPTLYIHSKANHFFLCRFHSQTHQGQSSHIHRGAN